MTRAINNHSAELPTGFTRPRSLIDNNTDGSDFNVNFLDPLLLGLGAATDDTCEVEENYIFDLVADATPFTSGSWLDFVDFMSTQYSLQRAPTGQKITAESKKQYHVYKCTECPFEAPAV